MIHAKQIARLAELGEYRQLVTRILGNGRCRSRAAKELLTRPEIAGAAAMGLALQRLTELSYGPCETADRLIPAMLAMQRTSGLFSSGGSPTPSALIAATSVAIRGLSSWLRESAEFQARPVAKMEDAVRATIHRAIEAIALLDRQGTKEPSDAVGWAVALWQLGDLQEFRESVRVDRRLRWLEQVDADVMEDELCRYAYAMAA